MIGLVIVVHPDYETIGSGGIADNLSTAKKGTCFFNQTRSMTI